MTYRFKLQLTRVQCVDEQMNEPGRDELRFFGFGVSRGGVLFSTGYRNLGSWSEGDDRSSGIFPMTLFEGDLQNDALDVMTTFWMIEEDTGGVAEHAAELETEFRSTFRDEAQALNAAGFPRECVPFTAFYRALLPFGSSLKSAASSWWNDDDVGLPRDFFFRFQGITVTSDSGQVASTFVVSVGGHYNCFFTYSYHQTVVATL